MNHSESIANISAAMAKAFAEIEGAEKNRVNPHFKSRYSDLANVVDAIKPALTKHGLWFSQISYDLENHAAVETAIFHSSGEYILCGLVSVPVAKNDPQGFGSAMTYARRYSLSAAFGVAPEDDDANSAKAPPKPVKRSGKSLAELEPLIRACSSVAELQMVWAGLTADERATVAEIKDEVKGNLA